MFTKLSCAMLILVLHTTVSAQAQNRSTIHIHRKKAPGALTIHDQRRKAPLRKVETTADRFNVKIEVLKYRSLLNADTPLNYPAVNYFYNVHADIAGIRRQSLVRGKVSGRPLRNLNMTGTIHFRNIKKPDGADQLIHLSAHVTDQYRNRTDGKSKSRNLDKASGATRIDLFKMAADSQADKAAQTVLIRNRNYLMIVRVTVIDVD